MTRRQIRGSGLFLSGHSISAGLKFVAEIIVVRYLATSDYGAWTYALAAVTFMKGITTFGLNRAISRFVPQHLERGEFQKFYGVMVFVLGTLAVIGLSVIGLFYLFPGPLSRLAGVSDPAPIQLMFVLIFMVPLETVDNVLLGVVAAFGDSKTIFVRRFLLHPGLRLVVAVLLVLAGADVAMLAIGYVTASLIGVSYYALSVVKIMGREGLLRFKLLKGIKLPVRRVLSYTVPVMAADWGGVFMAASGPLILGYFSDMSTVALYQVVVPITAVNLIVFKSFGLLFEPSASRLITREDGPGLSRLYWRSAVWVTVLAFPPFALTFAAAGPTIGFLYGERYLAAAPILSILALGQFIKCMVGFNAETLRVGGHLRLLVGANLSAVVTNIVVSIMLIPSMGALGAGVGAAAGFAVQATLNQIAVVAATDVEAFDGAYVAPYLTVLACIVGLGFLRVTYPESAWVLVPAVIAASAAVVVSARVSLSITDTFPELGRWGFLRRVLG